MNKVQSKGWGAARLFVMVVALAIGGCVQTYPLGMSEAEWQALSPQQKLDARAAEAELEKARLERQAEAARIEAQRRQALEAQIARAYEQQAQSRGVFGRANLVTQIVLEGGEVRVPTGGFDSGWRQHGTTSFALAECEAKEITLRRKDKSGTTRIYAKRVQGQIYLSYSTLELGCDAPRVGSAVFGPFPPRGASEVTVRNRIRNATIRTFPF